MSKSSDELLAKLKTSLPKPTSRVAQVNTGAEIADDAITPIGQTPPHSQQQLLNTQAGRPPGIPSTRAPKLSVSLYQSDVKRLDVIKDFMKSRGFRNLNDSEALRLACRSVEIGAHLVAVYEAMQQEDGRRHPGKSKDSHVWLK